MILLFSDRKSVIAKEIAEIFKKCGGDLISNNSILGTKSLFCAVNLNKTADIKLQQGIAIFCDESEKFKDQILPSGIIGICEENNITALKILKKYRNRTITCGLNSKNTVTISSFEADSIIAAIRRSITDNKGKEIEPCEFKISLNRNYHPFSVLAAVTALLLCGIGAEEF